MRPEISNELLLQVIRAWDPAEARNWSLRRHGSLACGNFGIRHEDGKIFPADEGNPWRKHCELVEFLLKDRPDLGSNISWPYEECLEACDGGYCYTNPWSSTIPGVLVRRIKAYEYLKAWKEKQESIINPHDVTLTIDGQTIEMIPGEPVVGYSAPVEVPATYEQLCPHCNGSKEVTGWHGKESCQTCG